MTLRKNVYARTPSNLDALERFGGENGLVIQRALRNWGLAATNHSEGVWWEVRLGAELRKMEHFREMKNDAATVTHLQSFE